MNQFFKGTLYSISSLSTGLNVQCLVFPGKMHCFFSTNFSVFLFKQLNNIYYTELLYLCNRIIIKIKIVTCKQTSKSLQYRNCSKANFFINFFIYLNIQILTADRVLHSLTHLINFIPHDHLDDITFCGISLQFI